MLRIEDLWVSYGHVQALLGVSLEVKRGARQHHRLQRRGKSTLLNTISGLVSGRGKSSLQKESGRHREAVAARAVPRGKTRRGRSRGRQVFLGLTVRENLMAGAYTVNAGRVQKNLDRMFEMYPILKERARQQAGTLRAGADARHLQGPMAGRAAASRRAVARACPDHCEGVFDTVRRIATRITVLVEQNATRALAIADYAYVLENGRAPKARARALRPRREGRLPRRAQEA